EARESHDRGELAPVAVVIVLAKLTADRDNGDASSGAALDVEKKAVSRLVLRTVVEPHAYRHQLVQVDVIPLKGRGPIREQAPVDGEAAPLVVASLGKLEFAEDADLVFVHRGLLVVRKPFRPADRSRSVLEPKGTRACPQRAPLLARGCLP